MKAILFILLLTGIVGIARGEETYKDSLRQMLDTHRRIVASKSDLESSEANLKNAEGGWYPTVKATLNYGYEDRAGVKFKPNSNDISVEQLVWDFGATNAAIKKADLTVQSSHVSLDIAQQDLLLEGLSAYINLFRAKRALEYAKQSMDNIRKQTGMEESRVELGGGLPADVLQAKSQLAGTQARLVRARGALIAAENRYRNVFLQDPPLQIEKIPVPLEKLPLDLEVALQLARERHYDLRNAQLKAQIAHTEVDRTRSAQLFPSIKVVGQENYRTDANGIKGEWDDKLVKLETNYSFNLGLANIHAVDAAQSAALASEYRLKDTLLLVEEQVRNALQALETARDNAGHLQNQAHIVAEFLRLAREERLLGSRSLIDVLTGETNLINAQSDAVSAEADVAIAAFTLLKTVGGLEFDVLP
ncbi:MAG: outer membrane efflux protein [Methylococcaceae bacterium]|nr:MAG: outer membrane efflux protein [Methylococcaceae bacterium]